MGAQAVRLSNVDIDNALKNRDFEVLFQPIFDLGNGALARVESFVRWRHASLGVLPPGAFISFFESQGRMSELTRYVLAQSLAEYRNWRGASAPGFSINLALSDLTDDAFSSHFAVLLRDSGFPADLITLECPMPPVTMETAQAAEHFRRLAETGARLAIEVRGRANDFLRTIEPFPFDEIKTGGAAILRFARTVRGPGLSAISELLEIANQANAAITAVGVEDQASLSALRGLGFAAAQGNHLGKVGSLSSFAPRRVNEVRALLGLEELTPQELAAMFRTEAPQPAPGAAPDADEQDVSGAEKRVSDGEEDLIGRLSERLAREETSAAQTPARKARARRAAGKKAEAKTGDDEALKAAAIARARRKAAAATPDEREELSASDAAAARSLQERLSRAFNGAPEHAGEDAAPGAASDDAPGADDGLDHELDFASLLDIAQEAAAAGEPQKESEAAVAAAAEEDRIDREEAAAMETHELADFVAEPQEADMLGHFLASAEAERDETPSAPETGPDADEETVEAASLERERARDEVDDAPAEPIQSAHAKGGGPFAAGLAAASPVAAEGRMRAALAISGARAYFRPGLRVGVREMPPPEPASFSEPQQEAPALEAAAQGAPRTSESPAPSAQAYDDDPFILDDEEAPVRSARAPAEAAPAQIEESVEAPAAEPVEGPAAELRDETASNDPASETGAQQEAAPAPVADAPFEPEQLAGTGEDILGAAAPSPQRRRRKKGFLQRTVIPYPTHFWPRSWKRAWRRAAGRSRRAEAAE